MSSILLATKLHRPVPPPRLVQRPHLIQRLNDGLQSGCQLTLISAPAGFGKSTCASEWLEGHVAEQPVAWLSLDPSDDDPARFMAYLSAALQTVDKSIGREIEGAFQTGQLPPLEPLVSMLLNDVQAMGRKFFLVLDDFQVIKESSILKAVELLIANQPENLHLVLITREDPQLPLARLRAQAHMTEVRAGDLRFTRSEAALFLNDLMELRLSETDIGLLEERTEGWVVGLQLAGLSMRGREDRSAFIAHLSGSHRYILSYLTEEVLRRQPEETQAFLLQTSILDKLNGGLCDAVTGRPAGESQALLEGLFSANLFLIPLDDEGQWFRYHHLFGDLLQARLRQAFPPQAQAGLHARAAAWFEAQGFAGEAIGHALAANDFESATRLIEQHTYTLVTRGELATQLRWMEALPPGLVQSRPLLLLAKVWALLFAGGVEQIEALLQQAEAQIGEDRATPEARAVLGNAAAVRAFFSLMSGDHAMALELAERAERLLPTGAEADMDVMSLYTTAAHSILPYTLGMAYRGQGQYEKAAEAFWREVQAFTDPQSILIWAIAIVEVAAVRRMQGQLRAAAEICRMASRRIAELELRPVGALARFDFALSEVTREQNELEETRRRVDAAIERVKNWNMPTDRLAFYLTLLRVQLSQADLNGAAETLRLAKELRAGYPVFLDLSHSLDMLEVRLALLAGDLAAAERLVEALQPGASRLVYLREQELILLARLRLAQGKPGEAAAILAPLTGESEAAGRMYAWLEGTALYACALEALGEREAALDLLLKALPAAQPEGFVRVFADEGLAMQNLLAAAAAAADSAALKAYITTLLDAFPRSTAPGEAAPSAGKAAAMVEPLTERELDVLRLIAGGLKYEEIAGRLFISLNTVRTYVKAIYGKLSVNNRTQAIEIARQQKLI